MDNLETKKHLTVGHSIGISGIMILAMLIFSPLIFLSKYIGEESSMFIYYIVAIGVASWLAYVIKRKATAEKPFINLAIRNKIILPFIILGTVALLYGVVSPISELIPMPEIIKKAFMNLAKGTGIFAFLMMVVAAPVLEELIFRGIILDGLLEKYSPLKSILISSILFGIVHLNPWQFVAAVILGGFSGWIYYKTKSLTLSIIIHATANFCGYITRLFIDESSMDKSSIEFYGGLLNYILIILASIIITTLCVLFIRKTFKKNEISEVENASR